MIEHLLHAPVEILDVLVRFTGKGIAGRSSPNQFLRVRIVQVDDECSHLVCALRGRRVAEAVAEPAPPSPTATETVVVSIESLVTLIHLHRHDGNIAARFHLRPTLGRER